QLRTTSIGTELTVAREPHHDDLRQKTQGHLCHQRNDDVSRAVALLSLEHHTIHHVAHHARQEHHEGVHHTLDQGEGDHVAVRDVADLVTQHRFDLIAVHLLHEAGAYGDQCVILIPARREGVGRLLLEDADFRHLDASRFGLTL